MPAIAPTGHKNEQMVYRKELITTAAMARADLLAKYRIGLRIGVQFREVENVLVRKGNIARRKNITGDGTLDSTVGYLQQRELKSELFWAKSTVNTDVFSEVGGFDTIGSFQSSEVPATVKIVMDEFAKTFGESAFDNIFHGDPAYGYEHTLGLFSGVILGITNDINKGFISQQNGNLIQVPAITAPADIDDITPYEVFEEAWMKCSPKLRSQTNVVALMTPQTRLWIINAYFRKYNNANMHTTTAEQGFRMLHMPNVELVDCPHMGNGDKIIFCTPESIIYGIDTDNAESTVIVDRNKNDLSKWDIQIQARGGVLIPNINASNFAVTTGTLSEVLLAGDYKLDSLDVISSDTAKGTVAKNPVKAEYPAGETVTLTATVVGSNQFVSWSDGVTTNPRTVTTKGRPDAYVAIFKAP